MLPLLYESFAFVSKKVLEKSEVPIPVQLDEAKKLSTSAPERTGKAIEAPKSKCQVRWENLKKWKAVKITRDSFVAALTQTATAKWKKLFERSIDCFIKSPLGISKDNKIKK